MCTGHDPRAHGVMRLDLVLGGARGGEAVLLPHSSPHALDLLQAAAIAILRPPAIAPAKASDLLPFGRHGRPRYGSGPSPLPFVSQKHTKVHTT